MYLQKLVVLVRLVGVVSIVLSFLADYILFGENKVCVKSVIICCKELAMMISLFQSSIAFIIPGCKCTH